uniref:PH domain-containing protein n=1 Tax=Pseudo-nitzschia australis TaxID=44445 RepID=A0A6V0ADX3_9STRA|mmetsp:Transcript_9156/g.17797  ORF Transcript_9156/g.17797 Transcript_9156/m.17797 type:complete len:878 (-) Transcript_9156:305-2938(-)
MSSSPVILLEPTKHTPRNEGRRDPAIRHSGRAHIRGKIRRVWRPRYLELCDSGFIRYYELPPLADVTMPEEADWQHVNMVIKDTLIIHHARIIDVTTLRDLHVGLPRGSYGFLFRGQRIGGNLSNTINFDFEVDHQQNAFVDMQRDTAGNACSAYPVGKEVNPPREYFCAVSTLEEAQSWVIALKWSVEACQKTLQRLDPLNQSDSDKNNESDDLCVTNLMKIGDGKKEEKESIDSNNGRRGNKTQCVSPKVMNHTRSRSGRILVTKVCDFRIIRVAPFLRWDVAYEVALLLVENNKDKVEERRILVTVQQLDAMLIDMSTSMRNRASLLDALRRQTGELPRFRSHGGKDGKRCNAQTIEASMEKLNAILRALAMEAAAVNSQPMRHLFGLDVNRPEIEEIPWWKPQRKSSHEYGSGRSKTTTSNKSTAPVLYRQMRSIPSALKVDDYVRQWLARPPNSLSSLDMASRFHFESQIWLLQRPWSLVGGLGVVLPLMYSVSRNYEHNMMSVTMRFDVLALTWGAAYWAGQQKGITAQQRKSRYQHSSQRHSRNLVPVSRPRKAIGSQAMNRQENVPNPNLVTTSGTDSSSTVAAEGDVITSVSSDEYICDDGDDLDYLDEEVEIDGNSNVGKLSSPIPKYPDNDGLSCWSEPPDPAIFHVRGSTYLQDRVKVPSGTAPFKCRGVDLWLTDNPERHIARHPSVLGGELHNEDTFLVNFLLPFGNFVAYFSVPPLPEFPNKQVANVWSSFVDGDQQYRDARLKLLPIVMEGPWIVKAAVGNGKSPALLGKVIPLQYFFRKPKGTKKGVYEVDVIITASSIAKGILSVVKGHAKSLSIAFALIIEAAKEEELPETALCSFQIHALNLDDCPRLPDLNLDDVK